MNGLCECRYFGDEIGQRSDPFGTVPEYGCRHSRHQSTTLAECLVCAHYVKKVPEPQAWADDYAAIEDLDERVTWLFDCLDSVEVSEGEPPLNLLRPELDFVRESLVECVARDLEGQPTELLSKALESIEEVILQRSGSYRHERLQAAGQRLFECSEAISRFMDGLGARTYQGESVASLFSRYHGAGQAPTLIVPTPFQRNILRALDGRALKKLQLAAEVCGGEDNGNILYRPGGLRELMDRGVVAMKRGVGFYRPDKPPPHSLWCK